MGPPASFNSVSSSIHASIKSDRTRFLCFGLYSRENRKNKGRRCICPYFEVLFMSSRRRLSSRLSKTTCVSFASSSSAIRPPLSTINFETRSKLMMPFVNVNLKGCLRQTFSRSHPHASRRQTCRSCEHYLGYPDRSNCRAR
jgi:hypothetical protein